WCMTQLLWVTFETANVPTLWEQVTRHIRGYLMALWATGMLQGNTTKESFIVKCDQTTMTQAEMRDGHLICHVGMAPVKPSEFIFYSIRIRWKPGDSSTRGGRERKWTAFWATLRNLGRPGLRFAILWTLFRPIRKPLFLFFDPGRLRLCFLWGIGFIG